MKELLSIAQRFSMKARVVLMLGMALSLGIPTASAQSLKDRFKKAAQKVGKQTKETVVSTVLPKHAQTAAKTAGKAGKKSSASKTAKSGGSTVNIPSNHAALFAALGTPVDAKLGRTSVSVSKPPKDESKQPAWNDARPSVDLLDNKSLVAEFVLLEDCIVSRYVSPSGPIAVRFGIVSDELQARVRALDRFTQLIEDLPYDDEDVDQAFIDSANRTLASSLKAKSYQVAIRSSIAPIIDMKGSSLTDRSISYFKKYDYANAHKRLTQWDPDKK